ncbi:hypothetical protein [Glaciecola sp. 1036]|uniref:hypothetical protein n=1 Tax=Alteromonadaceae TaxID=72275 RepID=UPI003D03BC5F
MNLFVILGVLFLALIIMVPLIDKSGVRMSNESLAKLSKWFMPLVFILIIAAMIKYFLL